MTIHIVNKYKDPDHIYCGRGSPMGNPFPMNDEKDRDEVCDQYAAYFARKIEAGDDIHFMDGLQLIYEQAAEGDVNLGCFCAPKRCHTETVKNYIEFMLERNGDDEYL